MKKDKPTHGGAREGAGRPAASEPSKTISFWVPASKAERLKKMLQAIIDKQLKK